MKNFIKLFVATVTLSLAVNVQASPESDQYYVSCIMANTELAPANQRFFCACQSAAFQKATAGHDSFFEGTNLAQSCQATINPYFEFLHKEKLAAQKPVDWGWL